MASEGTRLLIGSRGQTSSAGAVVDSCSQAGAEAILGFQPRAVVGHEDVTQGGETASGHKGSQRIIVDGTGYRWPAATQAKSLPGASLGTVRGRSDVAGVCRAALDEPGTKRCRPQPSAAARPLVRSAVPHAVAPRVAFEFLSSPALEGDMRDNLALWEK